MDSSLYLHLPFCTKWCSYCAFYSEEAPTWRAWWRPYAARLQAEILQDRAVHGPYATLFLGGGNPLCLPVGTLRTMIEAAGPTQETTVEMNPESLGEDFAGLCADGLVNRVSMGIQSMHDRFLKELGRNSDRERNRKGLGRLRALKDRYGVTINTDVICCIPGETVEDVKEDLREVIDLAGPDHVSLYALTLEEGTPLQRRLRPMPDDQQADMLFALWEFLASQGYEHYEVSNFARNGHYCRHNLRYWRLEPYVGLGSHAAGRLRSAQGAWQAVENVQDLAAYAQGETGSGYRIETLSPAQEAEEVLLTGLRTRWGIDKRAWRSRFGVGFDRVLAAAPSLDPSLYVDGPDAFRLTSSGLMVLDSVLLSLAMGLDQVPSL